VGWFSKSKKTVTIRGITFGLTGKYFSSRELPLAYFVIKAIEGDDLARELLAVGKYRINKCRRQHYIPTASK